LPFSYTPLTRDPRKPSARGLRALAARRDSPPRTLCWRSGGATCSSRAAAPKPPSRSSPRRASRRGLRPFGTFPARRPDRLPPCGPERGPSDRKPRLGPWAW